MPLLSNDGMLYFDGQMFKNEAAKGFPVLLRNCFLQCAVDLCSVLLFIIDLTMEHCNLSVEILIVSCITYLKQRAVLERINASHRFPRLICHPGVPVV